MRFANRLLGRLRIDPTRLRTDRWRNDRHSISRQTFPKRTCTLSIPSEPYSLHSVHSATGSRMNGMIRSFRKRNSSQKNTNTVYSEYSYSGIRNSPKRTRPKNTNTHKSLGSHRLWFMLLR